MTKFTDCSQEAKETKKETVFTHVQSDKGWIKTEMKPNDFELVKYMGDCKHDGRMFVAYHQNGTIYVFKGIKGDEFN